MKFIVFIVLIKTTHTLSTFSFSIEQQTDQDEAAVRKRGRGQNLIMYKTVKMLRKRNRPYPSVSAASMLSFNNGSTGKAPSPAEGV